ncbi:FAD-binding oxidoreductase [Nocardia acidivorans]|uniref:FAD-binding oxidoreductase n=1 Tax=Nocardia acidivorans TaxID=404580 RepID=UPI000A06ED15|nr:FAD-binding protein [Nocardia acidivorans]
MLFSRRRFLIASAAGAAASTLPIPFTPGIAPARAQAPTVVTATDPAYATLTQRGYNRRFTARPQRIHLPTGTEEIRLAAEAAVRDGLRIAVRAGGHGFENFVDNDRTQAIIDLNRMSAVYWDETRRAFSVDAGTPLGTLYERLGAFGVTVPAGICKGVGAGGHIVGGGYGPLSRQLGLMVDHLYGVEVITVDKDGAAETVLATKDGPNADLLWAHSGGGGGNFGVVSRYLLRSPDSDGGDPARALPKSPGSMLNTRLILPLLDEESFVRFLGNYLAFFEQHSAPDDPFTALYAPLMVKPGIVDSEILVLLNADGPDAQALFDEFVAAITAGVGAPLLQLPLQRAGYAETVATAYYAAGMPGFRVKAKSAYLRKAYSTEQLRILYRYFADIRFLGESQLEFLPFGGAVNAVAADATAVPARDSFMKMLIHAAWRLPGDDERFVGWAREGFRELYAETGGVPVPDAANGGSYINYPDPDSADPRWNTSGVPWHELYYGANYDRLCAIKARWDPNTVFQHDLSIGR